MNFHVFSLSHEFIYEIGLNAEYGDTTLLFTFANLFIHHLENGTFLVNRVLIFYFDFGIFLKEFCI